MDLPAGTTDWPAGHMLTQADTGAYMAGHKIPARRTNPSRGGAPDGSVPGYRQIYI